MTLWGADGKPLSAAQFLELLFGQLPEFFSDEDELRALWSLPDTGKKLREGLARLLAALPLSPRMNYTSSHANARPA